MVNFDKLTAREILALTIIGEARGESIEGQVAVGNVIKNRLIKNPIRYKNYHDVCLRPAQFSCWNIGDPNRPMLEELAHKMILGEFKPDLYHRQCMFVAQGIVEDDLIDNTSGAQNYMTNLLFYGEKKPKWADNARNVNSIGQHVFFNV